jgi:hypothetical protein
MEKRKKVRIKGERKSNQVVPQSHSACICIDPIQEKERMLEKMKMMSSKFCRFAMKVEKVEKELIQMRDEK